MAASNPRAQADEQFPAPMAHPATDAHPAVDAHAATDAHPAVDDARPTDDARPAADIAHPTGDAQGDTHQHRDVSGGWLRPAVFGAMDGLVTNVSLIAGVGGGG